MDYFNDVFATFLGLDLVRIYLDILHAHLVSKDRTVFTNEMRITSRMQYLELHQKYLHLCSEDERRSYR